MAAATSTANTDQSVRARPDVISAAARSPLAPADPSPPAQEVIAWVTSRLRWEQWLARLMTRPDDGSADRSARTRKSDR
jgi:hypothetical protein